MDCCVNEMDKKRQEEDEKILGTEVVVEGVAFKLKELFESPWDARKLYNTVQVIKKAQGQNSSDKAAKIMFGED